MLGKSLIGTDKFSLHMVHTTQGRRAVLVMSMPPLQTCPNSGVPECRHHQKDHSAYTHIR